MAYRIFFDLAQGINRDIIVPKGTYQKILNRVQETEYLLGYKKEIDPTGTVYWRKPSFKDIDDKVLCETASKHNWFVMNFYEDLDRWSKNTNTEPVEAIEELLTLEISKDFFYGLSRIDVPFEKWTRDYYVDRMKHLHEVMQGNEDEGVTFEAKKLTSKQSEAVILLFSQWMDKSDCRLAMPKGSTELYASDDGGYDWCEKCGAVFYEDAMSCNKRKCPVREEYNE